MLELQDGGPEATRRSVGGGDIMAAAAGGGASGFTYRQSSRHHGRLSRAPSTFQRGQGGRE